MLPPFPQFLVLLLILLPLGRRLGAQQLDMVRLGENNQILLPFLVENDFIVIPVRMNGKKDLRFIVDTGAENTVLLDKEIGDELDVDYRRKFEIRGADVESVLIAYLATGIDLEFDKSLLARNRSMLVLKERYFRFEEITGTEIHGILGADFLGRFVLQIDYRRRVIILREPRNFKPGRRYRQIPAEFVRNRAYLKVDIGINRRETTPRRILLDSGAGLPLLMHLFGDSTQLDLPEKVLPTYIANGLGGQLNGSVGRANRIELAGKELSNVVTFFQPLDTTHHNFLNGREGIMGNRILSRFAVVINYPNRKVYLKPQGKDWKKKFTYDRSGLSIIAGGRNLSQLIVSSVLKGSPGEKAGIEPGDRIRSIGGTPAVFLTVGGIIRRLEGKVGKKLKMRLVRSGRFYETVVILEELL